MEEQHVYHGNCHCGAFKYIVKVPIVDTVYACNCAYCFKKGYLWVPLLGDDGKESLEFERGSWEEMRSYRFGSKVAEHKFCPHCGSGLLATRQAQPNLRSINARMFRDLDVWSVKTVPYDGASTGPPYEPPEVNHNLGSLAEDEKVYAGSCHCGAVTLAVKTKPLESPGMDIRECNCSMCIRKGSILIYPSTSSVQITGQNNLSSYRFGKKMLTHKFCSTCGVSPYIEVSGPPTETVATLPEDKKEHVRKMMEICPVNIKILNGGVDWEKLQPKIQRLTTWKDMEPKYEVP